MSRSCQIIYMGRPRKTNAGHCARQKQRVFSMSKPKINLKYVKTLEVNMYTEKKEGSYPLKVTSHRSININNKESIVCL